jgi:ATP synthase I chain
MNYEQALQRMTRIAAATGVAGVLIVVIWRGPREAAGFLIGAILSMLNFRWWVGIANALGPSGRPPVRAAAMVLFLRYFLIAGAVYAIVKLLEIKVAAVLAGLFVAVAAVLIEILYELVSYR